MTRESRRSSASTIALHHSCFVVISRSPHAGNFRQGQNPWKNIDRFEVLQFLDRDRAIDRKPAGLCPPQILEMSAAPEGVADVVGVGADIKSFAANDGEIDFRQR